jgi:hypothetical protein
MAGAAGSSGKRSGASAAVGGGKRTGRRVPKSSRTTTARSFGKEFANPKTRSRTAGSKGSRTATPPMDFVTTVTPASALAPASPARTPPREALARAAAPSSRTGVSHRTPAEHLAQVRRRLDVFTNREQLRTAVLTALRELSPAASPRPAAGTSPGTVTTTDPSAGLSYEQLLVHVFSQHLHLGQLATRPAVEEDADTIADTIAGLLAAVPQFDGPWGPAIGPVYRTDQVRALLGGVSRQALNDRVKRSTLLALKTRDGATVYPAWQFADRKVLPGLAEVLKVFTADEHGEIVDGWTLASWLRTGLDELDGGSVADRLLAGDAAAARQAASHAAARWSR